MNKKYNECPICNDEVDDEKYADGLWDLADSILCVIGLEHDTNADEMQADIYYELQRFIERKGYCPNCGRRLKEDE